MPATILGALNMNPSDNQESSFTRIKTLQQEIPALVQDSDALRDELEQARRSFELSNFADLHGNTRSVSALQVELVGVRRLEDEYSALESTIMQKVDELDTLITQQQRQQSDKTKFDALLVEVQKFSKSAEVLLKILERQKALLSEQHRTQSADVKVLKSKFRQAQFTLSNLEIEKITRDIRKFKIEEEKQALDHEQSEAISTQKQIVDESRSQYQGSQQQEELLKSKIRKIDRLTSQLVDKIIHKSLAWMQTLIKISLECADRKSALLQELFSRSQDPRRRDDDETATPKDQNSNVRMNSH
jgi:hypothetical protein